MTASLFFVELTVLDLASSLAWYRDVIGLRQVMREGDSFAMLSAGSTRLALKQGMPTPGGVLLAFEIMNLDGWVARLEEGGIQLVDRIRTSDEGYRRVRVRDADGYAVSLFEWSDENRDGIDAEAPTPSRE